MAGNDKTPVIPPTDGEVTPEEGTSLPDGIMTDEVWNEPISQHSSVLRIDVEGFEGPLDLLLMLARSQKLDLAKISILALAEQYLLFINQMRDLKLDLAADYLVMASWLAYLKSKLLLPDEKDDDEPSGDELAAILAFRLQRLEAMRDVAAKLMARNRLGRDVFSRGDPEYVVVTKQSEYQDNLYDLLEAYARRRQRTVKTDMHFKRLPVILVSDAKKNIERILVNAVDWINLDSTLEGLPDVAGKHRSAKASNLSASLELVREGQAELRQEKAFSPLFIKAKQRAA